MTVKEIYERTVFGSLTPAAIHDYNTYYCGSADFYLGMNKKASRKNAAQKYRSISALLNQQAAVVKNNNLHKPNYEIITIRSFEGAFGTPLKEYQEIVIR